MTEILARIVNVSHIFQAPIQSVTIMSVQMSG